MANGRFITYQPSAITVINGQLTTASEQSIRDDLQVLEPYFDSLITYSAVSGAERVPDIAREMGFRTVVIGVWDITNAAECANAIRAAERNPDLVAGLSFGNETVLSQRGTWGDLAYRIRGFRDRTKLPLSTTEAFAEYLDQSDARAALSTIDFVLVNIHPIFESWFRSAKPNNWADFVVRVSDRLAKIFSGPILVKETGVPSGPSKSDFDENMQHDFWRALEAQMPKSEMRAFSYFSAFDAPWRAYDANPKPGAHPEEAYWGFFTRGRAPKRVIQDMPHFVAGATRSAR